MAIDNGYPAGMEDVFVIIDGNNLAHYQYGIGQGQRIPPEIDQRMLQDLVRWINRQPQAIVVELCLDHCSVEPAGADRVRVFVAQFPQDGDDELIERVLLHVYQEEPCLVITNDEALQDEVSEYQVEILPVFDFARVPEAARPGFATLPDSVSAGIFPASMEECLHPQTLKRPARHFKGIEYAQRQEQEYRQLVSKILARRQGLPGQAASAAGPGAQDAGIGSLQSDAPILSPLPDLQEAAEPVFQLALETWPVQQGIKFLLESFCRPHASEIFSMIGDVRSLQPDDLPALAALLLEYCGEEPDFVQRGGSLMDRVRLALLKAGDCPLTLAELSRQSGSKPAELNRKLYRSNGCWLTIRPSDL